MTINQNQNQGYNNTSNNKFKPKTNGTDAGINYQTNLTKEEIIKILSFCYDEYTNAIDINSIQSKPFDELIDLIYKFIDNSFMFNNKSDITRVVIRLCVSKGLYIAGSGLLELIPGENYGFIRSGIYAYYQSNDDVFVPAYIIKKYGLRYADEIRFLIKTDSESIDKRVSIDDVLQINGIEANEPILKRRKMFTDLVPIYPDHKIQLARRAYKDDLAMRIMDLFMPIGYGQRMLVVAPPKSGKTTIFQVTASSITQDNSVKVILLLIDERPEEVTDLKQNIKNVYKCFHSDFNEPSHRHTYISELCSEHAKRLCELGHKVFIFIDSLTRIARAYNCTSSATNKVMSGGIDLIALQKAKKLFGLARNTQSGSIGILATCLFNTGSKMDEVIFEEFKGTSNSDLFLDRSIAERGIFPSLDIMKSGTRKHELLLKDKELKIINKLRNFLSKTKINPIDLVIDKIKNTPDNEAFLESIALESQT